MPTVTAPPRAGGDAAVVARDRAIPGLGLVLDADAFAAALAERLPEAGIRGARARYLRYKPGTACVVAYTLDTDRGGVEVHARAHAQGEREKAAKVTRAGAAPSRLGPGTLVLEDDLVALWAFPNDSDLGVLPQLAARRPRRALLERILGPDTPFGDADLRPLRYKPQRRFTARLDTPTGARAIVKAYDRGFERARRCAAIAAGASNLAPVAAPLGWSRSKRVIVLDWLPGRPLDEILRADDALAEELSAGAGEALGRLHAGMPRDAALGRFDEPRRVAEAAEALAAVLPELGQRGRALARRLVAAAEGRPALAIHGDFSADQVIVDSGRAALVDLDECAIGDPATDLGSFVARLELEAIAGRLGPRAVTAAAIGLTEGYAATSGGRPREDVNASIARGLLRLATEPFRFREPSWPVLALALLERAEELADGC